MISGLSPISTSHQSNDMGSGNLVLNTFRRVFTSKESQKFKMILIFFKYFICYFTILIHLIRMVLNLYATFFEVFDQFYGTYKTECT